MRRRWLLLLPLTIGTAVETYAQEGSVVVYLVRHAERADDGADDPPLSEAGLARAALLTSMLTDAGVTRVHTTDLKRTRETGALLAARRGLQLTTYDARDLTGLAARIRATPGRHLVLGHSNTTGEAVAALGGDPGGPIDDAEYDRLYVVTIGADGTVATVLLRFGERFQPAGGPPGSMR